MKRYQSLSFGPAALAPKRPQPVGPPLARCKPLLLLMAFCLSLALLMPAWGGDGGLDPSFNPGAGVTKIPVLRGQSDWLDSGGTRAPTACP